MNPGIEGQGKRVRSGQRRAFAVSRRVRFGVTASLVWLAISVTGFAQQLQTPTLPTGLPPASPSSSLPIAPPTTPATGTGDDKADSSKNSSSGVANQNLSGALTSNQIIAILQERPELIV